MVNELELPSEDVAIALGRTDGDRRACARVRHRDRGRALDRWKAVRAAAGCVTAAYERTASQMQMRLV
jgi:hypothetical protein